MFSRAEITKILKKLPKKSFIPVGSYIQGKDYPQDIDLITTLSLDKVKDIVEKAYKDIEIYQKPGQKKKRLFFKYTTNNKTIEFNIWYSTKAQLPYFKFWLSYPKVFAQRVRAFFKKKGYKLTQYGVFKDKKQINQQFRNNNDFFAFLRKLGYNFPNRTPIEERSKPVYMGKGSIFDIFKGVRQTIPPVVRDNLKKYGDMPIVGMEICKSPIQGSFDTAIDWITFGLWKKLKKKLNYDSLFHLYMLLKLKDGTQMILQKNAVVEFYPYGKSEKDSHCLLVDLKDRVLTPNELMNKTIKRMGEPTIWLYDGENSTVNGKPGNCQNFIVNVLRANDFDSVIYSEFVLQNVNEMFELFPEWSKVIIKGVTNLGALWDRIKHGSGKKINF